MSADNWTVCPWCEVKRHKAIDALEAKTAAAYGKVGPDEWDRLRNERDAAIRADPPRTMREDYEIGIVEGASFEVDFRAVCNCGFSFEFKHSAEVK